MRVLIVPTRWESEVVLGTLAGAVPDLCFYDTFAPTRIKEYALNLLSLHT